MGSGLVGALAYTFSDTFWFSAVEGEVYAFSSLFTAVVFWLILKWEDVADQPHSDRWLILIAYLTGLSIGVHLLNLLCLPAIVLVYYYKKVPNANVKGSLLALLASIILVAAVLYGIVPGIVKVGGWFELFFVNTLGMSFNSGVIVYIIVLAAAIIWGVYESFTEKSRNRMSLSFVLTVALLGIPFYGHGGSSIAIGVVVILALLLYLSPKVQEKVKQKYRISARTLNTSLLCTMMIVIGYSSYAIIVIRSTANTPMDQNSPEDIFTLGEYLGREQYGTRPLFYGPAFSSKVALDVKDGYCEPRVATSDTKFIRKEKAKADEKDSYIEIPGRVDYEYAQNMLFPRMYSSQHAELYKEWMTIKGYDVPYDQCGETVMVNMPTQWENIKFFFSYQLNWMYWRYFMWDLVTRDYSKKLRGPQVLANVMRYARNGSIITFHVRALCSIRYPEQVPSYPFEVGR
jgi:Inorganic pyrophosphatase